MDNCLTGYNSCIFAYGQTGSGKTHTMLGHLQEAVGGGIGGTDHQVHILVTMFSPYEWLPDEMQSCHACTHDLYRVTCWDSELIELASAARLTRL